ncbi:MAG TPA: nitrile hydratase accessory protein [Burkholderiaceae bacterium]|nr:nitrile hydratase accessory protein [Burkholderiaceae bacterium]
MSEVRSIADAIAACGLPESTGAAFEAPWQAQLFAITLALHEAGHFGWPEWAACLSRAIRDAQAAGDPDLGNTYWSHWLTALERLLHDKGIAGPLQLAARREAIRAYSRVARAASLMKAE